MLVVYVPSGGWLTGVAVGMGVGIAVGVAVGVGAAAQAAKNKTSALRKITGGVHEFLLAAGLAA
jgi:hypothetical protein